MFKQKMVRSLVCVMLTMVMFIIGCGGHMANPVERYMPGDEKKSCEILASEVEMNLGEIADKQKKAGDRDVWNGIWFAAGCFILVPWFFMDSKGSYEVEIDALEARNKMLKAYYAEKGCVGDIADATE